MVKDLVQNHTVNEKRSILDPWRFDPDPYPDPASFFSGFQVFFLNIFLITYRRNFTWIYKDKKLLWSHKTAEVKVFLNFFCLLKEGSRFGSVQITREPEPNPGGPKTYGFYRSGSGTLNSVGKTLTHPGISLYRGNLSSYKFLHMSVQILF
jgi:hypothetical protein